MGSQYISEVQVQLERRCLCERCGKNFNYRYKLKGSGTANSILWLRNEAAGQSASGSASESVRKQIAQAFPAYPCPNCGHFQTGMVSYYRKAKLGNLLTFSIFCLAIFIIISLILAISTNLVELVGSKIFWEMFSGLLVFSFLIFIIKRFSNPKQSDVAYSSANEIATESNSIVPVPSAETPTEVQSLLPDFYASRKFGRLALFATILPPVSLIFIFFSLKNLNKAKYAFQHYPEYCPIPDSSGQTYSIISFCITTGFTALAVGAFL
jgi:hypothetical protein